MAKTYDTYKDSGIAWIGEIPGEWEVVKIKNLAILNIPDSFIDGDWIESPYITDDGIRYLTTGNIGDGSFKRQGNGFISIETFKTLNCKYAYPGDLVFSRLNAPYGRSCILPNDFSEYVLAVDNVILRTTHSKKYISYITQCDGYHKAVSEEAKGTTMKRISRTNLGNIPLPIPPLSVQQSISTFLDTKCGEIDSLISIQEEMISELLAYKQSVITEAVTKGLGKKAKMKNSGVEWIGDIPEEWEVCKVKNIFYLSTGTTPKSFDSINDGEETVNWYTPTDIIDGGNELWCSKRKLSINTVENEGICLFPPKTLMYVGIGATAGKVGFACVKGYSNQQITALISKGYGDKYFYYLLNSIRVMIRENAFFTTLPIINNSYLGQKSIPLPPLPVQQAIATYLDEKTSQIDSLIALKQSKIESLKEYKKSIIYEYVTGKKRV